MSKQGPDAFQGYKDLWGFHKAVHEDDWNDSQHIVLKVKNSSKTANFATTFKFGHPVKEEDENVANQSNNTQKVSAEEKITWKQSEFGGWDIEAKWKNNGDVSYDVKSDALKKTEVEGLQDAKLTFEGKATRVSAGWPTVGFKWSNKDLDVHAKSPLENPVIDFGLIYKINANNTFATQNFLRTDMKDTFFRLAWAGKLEGTGIQWVADHQGTQQGNYVSTQFSDNISTFRSETTHDNNTVNGDITYNWAKAAYSSSLGFRQKHNDHTWKFRLHDSGMARALLQWQLHRTTKVSVNTSLDLNEVAAGKLQAPLPWGLSFEVKY